MERRARVFISCGQAKKREIEAARRIAAMLTERGYDPYVAVDEHSPKSLRENIFCRLLAFEYFVFVDFRRERIGCRRKRRGSLFTNQELALAAFLDKKILPFQQRGVRQLDGMIQALQLNCIPFSTPARLLEVFEDALRKSDWTPASIDELDVALAVPRFEDATPALPNGQPIGRKCPANPVW